MAQLQTVKGKFNWTKAAFKAFEEIRRRMTIKTILQLPYFSKVFVVGCDASHVGVRGVLSQESHPVAYFSEKLNDAKQKYTTYDKEFYAVVQALSYWRHCLILKEFVRYHIMRFSNTSISQIN